MTRRPSHTGAPPAKAAPLQVATVTVRPARGGVVYCPNFRGELVPIPSGVWSTVPVSADVMIAIREGALERKPKEEKATPPEPPTSQSKPTPAPAVKRGREERKEWGEIVRYLETLRSAGELPDHNVAFHKVSDWLVEKELTMADSTIKEGIARHCSDWFEVPPPAPRRGRGQA
jgi:hypothetical protein